MNRSDVETTLRDMWETRPRRSMTDKKIGGVAAAIGRRYQIDPVLIRIGFVVATFISGVGIALYLAGWLLLAEEGDEVSPAEALLGRGRSSMSTGLTVVLGLATLATGAAMVGAAPSSLAAFAVIGGGLFLLHRHRSSPVVAATAPPPPADVAAMPPFTPTATPTATHQHTPVGDQGATEPAVTPPTEPPVTAPAEPPGAVTDPAPGTPFGPEPVPAAAVPGGSTTSADHARPSPPRPDGANPPAWDPLGVAPFAWDLPDPTPSAPPPAPEPKRRSAVTPVTLGLTLIAGGAAAVAATVNSTFGVAQVLGIMLAVLGAGLVIGSFVRAGRGLIVLAIPLALVTWMATLDLPFEEMAETGVGDRSWTATTHHELEPEYLVFSGNGDLDLSQLRLDGRRAETTVRHLFGGNLTVTVPDNLNVEAVCSARAGDVNCLGRTADGTGIERKIIDTVEDGDGTIVLTLSGNFGNVTLVREGE